MSEHRGGEVRQAPDYTSQRDRLEQWVLKISREAFAANEQETTEVIQALTGGFDVFCPQAYPSEQLHRVAACFLQIARLSQ